MRSDRLISLLLILQTRSGVTAPGVAKELGVSVRTVYRDVEALSAAGVPVWAEQGYGGGLRLLPGYRTDMTGLTAAEARALVAMSGRALPDDLGMGSALATAVHKLVAAVPASHRSAAEAARSKVLVDHAGWFRRAPAAPQLERVQDAVWAERRIRLRYRSGTGRLHQVLVDPYGLVAKTGLWYLVGAHRGRTRMWRVDRVESSVVLLDAAKLPPDLDLAAVWAGLRAELERPESAIPVEVIVRVRAEILSMLLRVTAARRLSPAEDTTPDRLPPAGEDGWVGVTLGFRADRGAVAALLPFGGDIEVLEPASARALMVATARAIVERHAVDLGESP